MPRLFAYSPQHPRATRYAPDHASPGRAYASPARAFASPAAAYTSPGRVYAAPGYASPGYASPGRVFASPSRIYAHSPVFASQPPPLLLRSGTAVDAVYEDVYGYEAEDWGLEGGGREEEEGEEEEDRMASMVAAAAAAAASAVMAMERDSQGGLAIGGRHGSQLAMDGRLGLTRGSQLAVDGWHGARHGTQLEDIDQMRSLQAAAAAAAAAAVAASTDGTYDHRLGDTDAEGEPRRATWLNGRRTPGRDGDMAGVNLPQRRGASAMRRTAPQGASSFSQRGDATAISNAAAYAAAPLRGEAPPLLWRTGGGSHFSRAPSDAETEISKVRNAGRWEGEGPISGKSRGRAGDGRDGRDGRDGLLWKTSTGRASSPAARPTPDPALAPFHVQSPRVAPHHVAHPSPRGKGPAPPARDAFRTQRGAQKEAQGHPQMSQVHPQPYRASPHAPFPTAPKPEPLGSGRRETSPWQEAPTLSPESDSDSDSQYEDDSTEHEDSPVEGGQEGSPPEAAPLRVLPNAPIRGRRNAPWTASNSGNLLGEAPGSHQDEAGTGADAPGNRPALGLEPSYLSPRSSMDQSDSSKASTWQGGGSSAASGPQGGERETEEHHDKSGPDSPQRSGNQPLSGGSRRQVACNRREAATGMWGARPGSQTSSRSSKASSVQSGGKQWPDPAAGSDSGSAVGARFLPRAFWSPMHPKARRAHGGGGAGMGPPGGAPTAGAMSMLLRSRGRRGLGLFAPSPSRGAREEPGWGTENEGSDLEDGVDMEQGLGLSAPLFSPSPPRQAVQPQPPPRMDLSCPPAASLSMQETRNGSTPAPGLVMRTSSSLHLKGGKFPKGRPDTEPQQLELHKPEEELLAARRSTAGAAASTSVRMSLGTHPTASVGGAGGNEQRPATAGAHASRAKLGPREHEMKGAKPAENSRHRHMSREGMPIEDVSREGMPIEDVLQRPRTASVQRPRTAGNARLSTADDQGPDGGAVGTASVTLSTEEAAFVKVSKSRRWWPFQSRGKQGRAQAAGALPLHGLPSLRGGEVAGSEHGRAMHACSQAGPELNGAHACGQVADAGPQTSRNLPGVGASGGGGGTEGEVAAAPDDDDSRQSSSSSSGSSRGWLHLRWRPKTSAAAAVNQGPAMQPRQEPLLSSQGERGFERDAHEDGDEDKGEGEHRRDIRGVEARMRPGDGEEVEDVHVLGEHGDSVHHDPEEVFDGCEADALGKEEAEEGDAGDAAASQKQSVQGYTQLLLRPPREVAALASERVAHWVAQAQVEEPASASLAAEAAAGVPLAAPGRGNVGTAVGAAGPLGQGSRGNVEVPQAAGKACEDERSPPGPQEDETHQSHSGSDSVHLDDDRSSQSTKSSHVGREPSSNRSEGHESTAEHGPQGHPEHRIYGSKSKSELRGRHERPSRAHNAEPGPGPGHEPHGKCAAADLVASGPNEVDRVKLKGDESASEGNDSASNDQPASPCSSDDVSVDASLVKESPRAGTLSDAAVEEGAGHGKGNAEVAKVERRVRGGKEKGDETVGRAQQHASEMMQSQEQSGLESGSAAATPGACEINLFLHEEEQKVAGAEEEAGTSQKSKTGTSLMSSKDSSAPSGTPQAHDSNLVSSESHPNSGAQGEAVELELPPSAELEQATDYIQQVAVCSLQSPLVSTDGCRISTAYHSDLLGTSQGQAQPIKDKGVEDTTAACCTQFSAKEDAGGRIVETPLRDVLGTSCPVITVERISCIGESEKGTHPVQEEHVSLKRRRVIALLMDELLIAQEPRNSALVRASRIPAVRRDDVEDGSREEVMALETNAWSRRLGA